VIGVYLKPPVSPAALVELMAPAGVAVPLFMMAERLMPDAATA
jgi:hypothetical protein